MPKIFSPDDRNEIRRNLTEIGRRHFLARGLRAAKIEDIATETGIAKGTFYNFFESKFDLCLEIYEVEEERLGSEIRTILGDQADPRVALREILALARTFLLGDSLLRKLQESGEYALLGRGVRREKLNSHQDNDLQFATLIVDELGARGQKVAVGPEVLAGLLRAYTMLVFHRQEIGEEVFESTLSALAEAIVLRVFQTGGME